MNLISFSLWGTGRKYLIGAERNVELAKEFYPGWNCLFWTDNTVPMKTKERLKAAGALIISKDSYVYPPLFWRFLVNDVPHVSAYIVRDADSRIGMRERAAVWQWLESGRAFHTMRDHPAHARPINGGMWGARHGAIPSMAALIDAYPFKVEYMDDQEFLGKMVWPMVKDKAMQHDSVSANAYPGSFPFPTPRKDQKDFVGAVYEIDVDGKEFSRPGDWEQIKMP